MTTQTTPDGGHAENGGRASGTQPADQLPIWQAGPPAGPAAIEALAAPLPGLPEPYLQFIARQDGSEGDLGVQPGWAVLWPAVDVVAANAEYEVGRWLPGFLAFGSNGGGELLAFDTRRTPWPVCMVPCIGMDEEAVIEIAPDFETLAGYFGVVLTD